MGLFDESQPVEPVLRQRLADAYASGAVDDTQAAARAAQTLDELKTEVVRAREFKPWRVVAAIVIFGALVVGAIVTDAAGLVTSSAALYGFAGSVFGIVVGFLGSEKPQT